MSAAVIPIGAAAGGVGLSLRHEAELRAYFALDLPPPPGGRSSFGPMCERLENGRNPKTKELPSVGVPWTEMVECSWGRSSARDGEDAFVAYVDARRFVTRVEARLMRLTAHDRETLQAHYTERDLAPLTPTAERENRERAAHGRHQTIGETVASIRREAKDVRTGKPTRDAARSTLGAMNREAREMLRRSRQEYAQAARDDDAQGGANRACRGERANSTTRHGSASGEAS